ncbi:hypothetical protein CRYUN_Cryun10bG0058000 [Craigia yunnanensis]
MIGLLRIVWKQLREALIIILDRNLFLFKFTTKKDNQRVMEGSPWSFDKHLIVFKDYDGNLRPSKYAFDKASF